MTRLEGVVVVLGLALAACEVPPPAGACGGVVCVEGQRCDADTLTCVTDEAPLVTLTAPTTVVTAETFTVTGTARDDVAVTGATWTLEGSSAKAVTLANDGSFSLTLPTPLADEQALTLVVRASDGAREGRAEATLRVDRVGPAFEQVTPGAAVTVTGETTTVEVLATDASGSLTALRIGGTDVASPSVSAAASVVVPVPAGLDGAIFEVPLTATDAHGNVARRTLRLRGDRVGPALVVTQPTAAAVLASATARIEGTVTDPTPPVGVRVDAFDGGWVDATVTAEGGWSIEVPVPGGEQAQSLRVEARDGVGNASAAFVSVHVDRVAPTVVLTAPAAGSVHRQAFTVAATTAGDATLVTASLGGGAAVTLSGGPTSWTAQVPLPAQDFGALDLVVAARDAAGNAGQAQASVFVDTVAPTVTFTAPASGRKFNLADFTGTQDVTVSWQVSDGDTQAATTQVNAAASTATQLTVATAGTDNGRAVTTSVTAADRAGNTGTATLRFSVDRVRPVVTTWAPADQARNVEPRVATVTFSEPVFGATSASDALSFLPTVAAPGTWDTAHTTWTGPPLAPYTSYEATLGAMADDHGNVVSAQGRRLHTAALAASSTTPLATNVLHFRAASDPDGVVTIAYAQNVSGNAFKVQALSPKTLTLVTPAHAQTTAPLDYGLNAWNNVDLARGLDALEQVAWVFTHAPASGTTNLHTRGRYFSSNGVSAFAPTAANLALLTQPTMVNEPTTGGQGQTLGAEYSRNALVVTLPFEPSVHVAQSSDSFAAYRVEADRVRWARVRCNRDRLSIPNTVTCSATEFASPITLASGLSVAMNPGGQCLVTLFETGNDAWGVFQPLPNCDVTLTSTGCPGNTALTPVSRPYKTRVAPFFANGENTLLAAWRGPNGVQLGKLTNPAACTDAFTPIGPPVAAGPFGSFQPVQLGTRAALLYVDSTDNLRIFVP